MLLKRKTSNAFFPPPAVGSGGATAADDDGLQGQQQQQQQQQQQLRLLDDLSSATAAVGAVGPGQAAYCREIRNLPPRLVRHIAGIALSICYDNDDDKRGSDEEEEDMEFSRGEMSIEEVAREVDVLDDNELSCGGREGIGRKQQKLIEGGLLLVLLLGYVVIEDYRFF